MACLDIRGLACKYSNLMAHSCPVPCAQIDFISLSFVREADDLIAAREFLDSVGANTTKVRPLGPWVLAALQQ